MSQITMDQLTTTEIGGDGAFDKLMQAFSAHIQKEYDCNRIRGTDYSTVYLGGLQSAMDQSIRFLLDRDNAELIQAQIALTNKKILLADKEIELMQAQIEKMEFERDLTEQQVENLKCEKLKCEAEIANINQDTQNKTIQETVLVAQECKLRAEFDLLTEQKVKTSSEIGLLNQKKVTEQAQTQAAVIEPNSVIGKQTALYQAQTEGYARDAEQKAAKIMIDTWGVRRTTDEGTLPSPTNKLEDSNIGQVVGKMLSGINA